MLCRSRVQSVLTCQKIYIGQTQQLLKDRFNTSGMCHFQVGLEPGNYSTFKPTTPGQMPSRRSRAAIIIEPSTPSNNQGPTACGNCRCVECLGPPCLSPLSRPPLCTSCEFRHGPTYTQCPLITTNDKLKEHDDYSAEDIHSDHP